MKDSFPSKRVMSEYQAVNSNQKLYEWYSEAHNINVLMKKFQNTVELQRLVKQSEDINHFTTAFRIYVVFYPANKRK